MGDAARAAEPVLLAVPNVSEGRDMSSVAAIGAAFSSAPRVRLLDVHSDGDHNRSVYTLAGPPASLSTAIVRGAAEAVARIDVMTAAGPAAGGVPTRGARGVHPYVGALDVAPVVYLDQSSRGAACAETLVLADRIGAELGVPVFLYGELTASGADAARTRAELRRGGVAGLAGRIAAGELRPDFGPARLHASAGATLAAARPPLVAFNLQLAGGASVELAREVAASIREGAAAGLPGLRAIGVQLSGGVAQVSMNVERPHELTLAQIVERVRQRAPVASAELVGLAPSAALEGFPEDIPLVGFDRDRKLIERAVLAPTVAR